MTARSRKRWILAAGVSLVGVLAPHLARAETCPNVSITLDATVPRYPLQNSADNPKNTFPSRPDNLDPTAIDVHDCDADIHLEFSGAIAGLPCTDTMQVWVGTTDCTETSAREANSGAVHCWPVAPPFALRQAFAVDIRAQDLVAFIRDAAPPSTYSPQGNAACESLAGGVSGSAHCRAVSLGVYFMAMEADGLTLDGTPAMYSFDADVGLPDGGSCSAASADAGPDEASSAGSAACAMAAGRSSDIGFFGGLGVAGLVAVRRRRAATDRSR